MKNCMCFQGVKFRTKEPVDPRVLTKMYELTRQGVTTVKMMQEAIAEFVREELFPCGEPPPSMYRRYNPTSSDIQNAMYKVICGCLFLHNILHVSYLLYCTLVLKVIHGNVSTYHGC